jgi:hypothetical protein
MREVSGRIDVVIIVAGVGTSRGSLPCKTHKRSGDWIAHLSRLFEAELVHWRTNDHQSGFARQFAAEVEIHIDRDAGYCVCRPVLPGTLPRDRVGQGAQPSSHHFGSSA